MSASLVGSEMCIRDSVVPTRPMGQTGPHSQLGICRNSEPRSPEAGARGAALRGAPPALGSALWRA
eukprot:9751710-Alexandrium_andersonii.AAC.1